VMNYGAATLSNVTVRVNVYENGTLYQQLFPGNFNISLLSAEDTVLSAGSVFFTAGNTYDIVAWTEMPNFVSDPDNSNDTLSWIGMGSALSGTYTVGGASADFGDLAAVEAALNNNGICGPTIFELAGQTFSETL